MKPDWLLGDWGAGSPLENKATSQDPSRATIIQQLVGPLVGSYQNTRSWVCGDCGEPFQLPYSLVEAARPRCDCSGSLIPDPAGNSLDDLT